MPLNHSAKLYVCLYVRPVATPRARRYSVAHMEFIEPIRPMLRLDYLSCILTVVSTILIGRRMWHGWIIAAINSVVVCLIGIRTAQFGFVPANLFCLGLYANNLSQWRLPAVSQSPKDDTKSAPK
jgi:hypothetical protein